VDGRSRTDQMDPVIVAAKVRAVNVDTALTQRRQTKRVAGNSRHFLLSREVEASVQSSYRNGLEWVSGDQRQFYKFDL
jgi:hypothetical protein